ncbi:ribosomal-protein-alanine N-acetyltransferase, partial [Enterococcus faecium]
MLVTKKEISVANIGEELWRFSNSSYTTGSPWTETQFAEDFAQENSEYLFLVENGQW